MTKLQSAQSCVYSIMDKLGPVREALAQKDDDWEEWGFEELVENSRKEHYIPVDQQSETRRGL